MTEFDVPAATQDELLDAARRGELSQSDDPTAVPVSVDTLIRDDAVQEVSTFEDGSIQVVERERPVVVPKGMVTPLAVTGCRVTSGSGSSNYSTCKVHYRTHVFSYGFYANFTITPYYDQITWAGSQFQEYVIGHSRNEWGVSVIKSNESSTGPAHAALWIDYTTGLYEIRKGVRLKVGGNTYWQENQ